MAQLVALLYLARALRARAHDTATLCTTKLHVHGTTLQWTATHFMFDCIIVFRGQCLFDCLLYHVHSRMLHGASATWRSSRLRRE